jgi:D-aminopeptidase
MMRLVPGPLNLITDVVGLRVGNADDAAVRTGVTVLTADAPFVAAVDVRGGAPGTRETDLLAPGNLVQAVDALVLSGGSALGLAAASGVADALRAAGRGFAVGDQRVPIVPAAILFDLGNGGAKDWSVNPYPALGAAALAAAMTGARADFALGTAGAGYGATTATFKGGLGSTSVTLGPWTVGALVAVNAVGGVTAGAGPRFHAGAWEMGAEFGGLGPPQPGDIDPGALLPTKVARPGTATTLAIVATDAALDRTGALRMAVAAQDGIARAIVPAHTAFDGDLVFAAATGTAPAPDPVAAMWIGHAAAVCLTRAIARAVFHARSLPGDPVPAWAARFG